MCYQVPFVVFHVTARQSTIISAQFQLYLQVFIIAHVPPGMFELVEGMSWFYDDYNRKYLEVLEKYSDVVAAQLYGHEHTDSLRLQYDKEGNLFHCS